MQILQRRVQCSQLSNQPCSSAGCSAWGKTSTHFPATQRRLCTEHSRTRHIRSSASNPSTRVGELDPSLGDLEDSWTDSVFLPNGLEVHSVSKADVAFLYDEIWEQRAYLDHGISIGPGDTVLDVGANIGLFSIQAARSCPGGRVLAIEPIPSIFSALKKNIALNVRGPPSARVDLINAGLSDGQLHQADFTFYEQAAGWSTMCEDEEELRTSMDIFLATALSTGEGLGDSPLASTCTWLHRRTPLALSNLLTRLYVRWMLSRATKATCPLFTLSQIIEEYDIERVDLLKIDVERAELDVLNGIAKTDWPKIKQVVMEVHDIDDRLTTVAEMLRGAGLQNIVQQQSKTLKDSTLFNVYAKRTF